MYVLVEFGFVIFKIISGFQIFEIIDRLRQVSTKIMSDDILSYGIIFYNFINVFIYYIRDTPAYSYHYGELPV